MIGGEGVYESFVLMLRGTGGGGGAIWGSQFPQHSENSETANGQFL